MTSSKFCFIPLKIIEDEDWPSEKKVISYVKKRLAEKKVYPMFADVPVKERTVVLRVDFKKGQPVSIFECARTKAFKSGGERKICYRTSYQVDDKFDIEL